MRLHVLSDLHEEFGPFDMSRVDHDVLVLAGDVQCGTTLHDSTPYTALYGHHA